MTKSDFVLGGVAAMGAVMFTNPIDVVKTRMQLQGELAARGTYVKPYRNLPQAMVQIVRNDGLIALEKGLAPALCYQFLLNSVRLSVYSNALELGYLQNKDGCISFYRGMFFGALGGCTGTFLASPFYMIKAQQHAQAVQSIAVGFQHKHTSMIEAFLHIYRTNGIPGFWRGVVPSINRALVASSVQIGSFPKAKAMLKDNGWVTHPVLLSFCSGLASGSLVSVANSPFDVVTTRMYNQPVDEKGRGLIYRGLVDCFTKILRTEGLHGMYKGFWPIYLRSAPHTTLIFVFFDKLLYIRDLYVFPQNKN
ncbi:solute carrier family 25 member 35 [Drosophila rhopaloa]|uniref:Solute carrier family 25 member 35-like n=1 Tax=Drosophila rhopaloa TaxID=1041015 RepID=A0A6P4EFD4_DRORH|nr:solute carrier family 25 member 35 [Drosophila rhopaloa]